MHTISPPCAALTLNTSRPSLINRTPSTSTAPETQHAYFTPRAIPPDELPSPYCLPPPPFRSRPHQTRPQRPIKLLHPNRHLQRIKRILHHKLGISLIAPPRHRLGVRLLRTGKQQKFGPRRRLEACQAEAAGFKTLDAGGEGAATGRGGGCTSGEWGGGDRVE